MLAAMLPVTVVTLLLAAVFWLMRASDNEEVHSQSARALVRQVAAASEYGLFSSNREQLRSLASRALSELDVCSVAILDASGGVLVQLGRPGYATPLQWAAHGEQDRILANGNDLLSQAITPSQVKLDDLFQPNNGEASAAPNVLGHVLIEFSHERMHRRELDLLFFTLALGVLGLSLGGLLAQRLGRRVIDPVSSVSKMIERIANGELSARATVSSDDPLGALQLGLNRMAESLESGRDELERRVALATLALREKKEEAEAATLAKSRFLAAASHDLRQPTHALGMFLARLGQLEHNSETRHLIANLEMALQALRDLLDGLLDISRLDAGAVQVQLQSFALDDIFEQLRVELGLTAAAKGLRLRIRSSPLWLHSDPALLHRILLNLTGNALRYTEVGGVLVACRLNADGRQARIEVWDSGIGIAPEHQEDIFKEFYQVGNLERERGKGLGLGLNIVQRTAHLLGHRLQLWSQPGLGSRFSVEVPVALSAALVERRRTQRAKSLGNLAGLVVQVIEDDVLAREGLASLLVSWGVTVIEADSLAMALAQWQQGQRAAVLISDYRLPGDTNGIAAVRQLRLAAGRDLPAVLISGDTDPAVLRSAGEAGLILLHKPVRAAKLRNLLRHLSAARQAEGDELT